MAATAPASVVAPVAPKSEEGTVVLSPAIFESVAASEVEAGANAGAGVDAGAVTGTGAGTGAVGVAVGVKSVCTLSWVRESSPRV